MFQQKSLEKVIKNLKKDADRADEAANKALKKNDEEEAKFHLKKKMHSLEQAAIYRNFSLTLQEACSSINSKIMAGQLSDNIAEALSCINNLDSQTDVEKATNIMQEFCDTASKLNIGMEVHQEKMNEAMNKRINDDEIMDQLEAKKRELAINVNSNIADASTQQIQTQQSISAPQASINTDDFARRLANLM